MTSVQPSRIDVRDLLDDQPKIPIGDLIVDNIFGPLDNDPVQGIEATHAAEGEVPGREIIDRHVASSSSPKGPDDRTAAIASPKDKEAAWQVISDLPMPLGLAEEVCPRRHKARRLRRMRNVLVGHTSVIEDYSVWVGWTWNFERDGVPSQVSATPRWVYGSITNDILRFRAKGPLGEEPLWSGGRLASEGSGVPSTSSHASATRPCDIVWRRDFALETREQQKAFVKTRIVEYLQSGAVLRKPVVQLRKWIHCVPVVEYETLTTGR